MITMHHSLKRQECKSNDEAPQCPKLSLSSQLPHFYGSSRELGPECNTVSWSKNEKPLIGYIYERVGEPKFLCFNPRCSNARSYSNVSQIVDIKNKHTTLRRLVPIPGCPECKASNRPKRQRKQRDYFE